MERANVEIVERYFDAFDNGELDVAASFLHPDVEWHNRVLIDDETIRGRAAVREYWDRILSTLLFTHHEKHIVGAGERVWVTAVIRARGAASGAELEGPCGYALTVRDGLITHTGFYADPDEARRAAGIER